uniref:HIT family member n=1 Tax=Campylobacter jejuni subsp. jejuni serotype O:23/36 (strain 81-176) TaxID=354242 RepID=Q29W31_CAMJJ|nr:HIT family member [Campylobacter jejuni subsp. jejuni 81-176]
MIYENDLIYIEKEEAQVPWLKIFTKEIYKEFSDCPLELQKELFEKILLCEKAMIEFTNLKKSISPLLQIMCQGCIFMLWQDLKKMRFFQVYVGKTAKRSNKA